LGIIAMPSSQNVFHFYRLIVGAGSEKRSNLRQRPELIMPASILATSMV